jgi:hypothetical protein
MPKAAEMALEKEAEKKGLTGDRKNAYIYGTLNKMGLMPKKKKKAKRDMTHADGENKNW